MADVNFTPVTANVNQTLGGTFDLTDTAIDETKIKGAYFLSTAVKSGESFNTPRVASRYSYGFTDLTNSHAVAMVGTHGASISATARLSSSTDCIIETTNLAANRGSATFDSTITNGIRLETTTAWTSATVVVAVIIWGDDVDNLEVGHTGLGTGTSAITETLGWEPTVVWTASNNSALDTGSQTGTASQGIITADGQRAWGFQSVDGTSSAQSRRLYQNTSCLIQSSTTGTAAYAISGALTATGMTFTPSASAGSDDLVWMAMELGGDAVAKLQDHTIDPSDTDISITGLSFKPAFVQSQFMPFLSAVGASGNGSFGPATIFMSEDAVYGAQASSRNSVGTMEEYSAIWDKFGFYSPVSRLTEVDATSTTWGDSSFTMNITNNLGATGRVGYFLLIGSPLTSDIDVDVDADNQELVVTTQQASVDASTEVDADTQALTVTTYAATIETTTAIVYDGGVDWTTIKFPLNQYAEYDFGSHFSGTETPFTYTYNGGSLTGLSFDTTTGILSGICTQEAIAALQSVTGTDADTNTAETGYFQIEGVRVETEVEREDLIISTYSAEITFDVEVPASNQELNITTYQASISTGAALQAVKVNGILV